MVLHARYGPVAPRRGRDHLWRCFDPFAQEHTAEADCGYCAASGAVLMISPSPAVRIVIATKPVDFRKGHDGLAALAERDLGLDPHSGVIIVFRAKRGDRIKVLLWDGSGMVMSYKRLEEGKFAWPKISDGVMRLSKAQFEALFEDLEVATAEAEAQSDAIEMTKPRKKRKRAQRNLGNLPGHLERIEQVVEPDSITCPCGCGDMVRIGEDRTERLDIVPAQFRVIVTVRPIYACPNKDGGVAQAAAPRHLIEGGLPTEALLAYMGVSKYADHCPLFRQCQIYARSGIHLDRATLANWMGKMSFHLAPVVDHLLKDLKGSDKLFMDETRCPVLDPGWGRTKTGFLWAIARDERPFGGSAPPGVVFYYADGRGGKHATDFLKGSSRSPRSTRLKPRSGAKVPQNAWL